MQTERPHLAMVVLLLVLGATALVALTPAFAQGPPPPRTVPSIGLRTPDPTTASPATIPSIGIRTPNPTTYYPAAVPSVGVRTPDPTTAYPAAIIHSRAAAKSQAHQQRRDAADDEADCVASRKIEKA